MIELVNLDEDEDEEEDSEATSEATTDAESQAVIENTTNVEFINLLPDAVLLDLKNVTSDKEDIPVGDIRILLRGSDLEDDQQLVRDLPFDDFTTFLVKSRCRGGARVINRFLKSNDQKKKDLGKTSMTTIARRNTEFASNPMETPPELQTAVAPIKEKINGIMSKISRNEPVMSEMFEEQPDAQVEALKKNL